MKTTIKEAWKRSQKKKDQTEAWVTFKDIEEPTAKQVWVIDSYDPSYREYYLYNLDDTSKEKWVKGDKECYTGFTF